MRKHLLIPVLLLVLFATVAFGSEGNRTEDSNATSPGSEGSQWLLTADKVVSQHDSEFIQAWGNATLRSGSNYLRADFARYYQQTKWVYLKGHVRAKWEGDFYQADEAEFDLSNMAGWLTNGKVFVAQPHLFFESAMIRKLRGDSYTFKNAKVTACSGDKPAWSLTAEEGHITLDGYAQLWHAKFNVKDVTVMYTPYLSLPTKQGRQTGLLVPQWQSSSRLGFGINQPYYVALDDERDMTFYGNFMSDRGLMYGLEYRDAVDVESKGLWRFDYLQDWKTESELKPKYQFDDGLDRDNRDRFWFRSKYNGFVMDPAWKVKMDIDYASDQDYLREFEDGYSGYSVSRREFLKEFNRGLQVHDAMNRTSTIEIVRNWNQFGLAARADYTENFKYMNSNNPSTDDPTIQRLPRIDLYAFKENMWDTLFEWEGRVGFDYFWREKGTTGGRLDINPKVSAPVKLGGFTFIPSVGFRQTNWMIENYEDEAEEVDVDDKSPMRFVPEASFDAFTEAYRVYDIGSAPDPDSAEEGEASWTRLMHTIQPRVRWDWASDSKQDQQERSYFDRDDRLLTTNTLAYSLTNVFDRRRESVSVDPDEPDGAPHLNVDYRDFARFRLEQSYDFEEAARDDDLDLYDRRPFSDILAEIIVNPLDWVELSSRTWVSPYEGTVTEHEHMLRLHEDDWGSVYFGYDYVSQLDEYKRKNEKNIQILRLGGRAFLSSRFWVDLDFRQDLFNDRELEKSIGLTWNHECFRLTLKFTDTSTDQRFAVMFDLIDF